VKKLNWKIFFIPVILALVMACGGSNTPTPQAAPQETDIPTEKPTVETDTPAPIPGATDTGTSLPVNALIAYISNRTGNYEIYSSYLDGSETKQLTDDPADDTDPDVSPDGSKIVFTSTRNGNKDIYVMDADGGNLLQITDDPADDYMPAWSPNGKVIAFTSRRSGNSDIYLVDAGGAQTAQYTNWPSDEMNPCWSPTDPVLAFASTRDGDLEIFVMGTDGNFKQLTQNDYTDAGPDWSPNGRFIIFSADTKNTGSTNNLTDTNLQLIEPTGKGLQQVTSIDGLEVEPAWSPDSNYILFSSMMAGNADIFLLEENGTFYRITNDAAVDSSPSWGPITEK
jgi:TolB protein